MAETQPDFSTGIMVCVRPQFPERFVAEGGTPLEDIHLTIAYLGKTSDFPDPADRSIAEQVVGDVARGSSRVDGEVTATTVFGRTHQGQGALVLLVDAIGLNKIHVEVMEQLKLWLPEGHLPAATHGFMPHMTFCWGPDEDDITDAADLIGEKVEFGSLELVWGTESTMYPLDRPISTFSDNSGLTSMEAAAQPNTEGERTMPYEIVKKHPECESADGFAVVKTEGGELMGCHADESGAKEQLAALNAAEGAEAGVSREERLALVDEFVAAEAAGGGDAKEDLSAVEVEVEVEVGESEDDAEDDEAEMATFAAMPSHDSPTIDPPTFQDWDGDVAQKNARSGETEAYYGKIYAWHNSTEPPGNKTSYKFPHHVVSTTGEPGAAVMWAVHACLSLVDDAAIPAGDRQGVYNHLARHLRDGGIEDIPDLGHDTASAEEVQAAISTMRARFMAMSQQAAIEAKAAEAAATSKRDINEVDDLGLMGEVVRRWLESVGKSVDAATLSGEGEEFAPEVEAPEVAPEVAPEDEVKEAPAPDDTIGLDTNSKYDWEGVLIVEGLPSGDGRMIEEEALTWRDLPVPLMLQTVNAGGHDGAVIAGSIHEIERRGHEIVGRGYFDSGESGQEARRLLAEGTMRGVSADIDSVMAELRDASGADVSMEDALEGAAAKATEVLVKGRIMGATMTPFPAFQEAYLKVIASDDQAEDVALVASGAEVVGEVWRFHSPYALTLRGEEPVKIESLVASGATVTELPVIPVNPPVEWFAIGEMTEPTPFHVAANGRIYGLVAQWGACHIGFRDRCVQVPRSGDGYRNFRNKSVLSAEGEMIATGPIYMDTVHPSLKLRASDTQAFYAETGCAVADVALYENEFGIVAAGALRPDATPEQIRRLRGSDVSPDWRSLKGRLEVVGLLAVNVSGFITPALVAAGGGSEAVEALTPRALYNAATGEFEALVAAGSMRPCTTCGQASGSMDNEMALAILEIVNGLKAEVATLNEITRPLRFEAISERVASMALKVQETPS